MKELKEQLERLHEYDDMVEENCNLAYPTQSVQTLIGMVENLRVIHVTPNVDDDFDPNEFAKLSSEDKLSIAEENIHMEVYTLQEFETAFNDFEEISDLGYIYFVC